MMRAAEQGPKQKSIQDIEIYNKTSGYSGKSVMRKKINEFPFSVYCYPLT